MITLLALLNFIFETVGFDFWHDNQVFAFPPLNKAF